MSMATQEKKGEHSVVIGILLVIVWVLYVIR